MKKSRPELEKGTLKVSESRHVRDKATLVLPWGSLKRLCGVFASHLRLLEASLEGPWGVLGAPVEGPGGAWSDLGPSLERPCASLMSPWSVFAAPLGFKLEPQRGLQRVQESRHVLEKVTLKGREG